MYKVVRAFFDSTDKNRLYKVGDVYPAEGVKANKKRTDELAKGTNPNGKVYIEEVKAEVDAENEAENGAENNDVSQG